jgi:hypothetical protein
MVNGGAVMKMDKQIERDIDRQMVKYIEIKAYKP